MIKSVVAIILQNEKVLLLRRHSYDRTLPDKLCLPGGKVDGEESDEEALTREVMEETKLKVVNEAFITSKNWTSHSGKAFHINFYGVEVENYNVEISDEHQSYIWIDIEDLQDYSEQIADQTYSVLRLLSDNKI